VAGTKRRRQELPPPHSDPAGASRSFAETLLAGDVHGATRCFDPRGVMLSADGTEVVGHESIAEILAQIAAWQVPLRIRLGRTLQAGPVAMATQIWDRDITGFTVSSTARLVLHESAGRWSISVAAPWGERLGNHQ
jgi:ketosteroid isomerase-like protein